MRVWTEYPGLLEEFTPAGNPRWRVRVEGDKSRRITIPVGPSNPAFKDHYEAARLGIKLEAQIPAKVARGTFDEQCERFNAAMVDMVTAGVLNEDTRTGRQRGLRQAANVKMRGRRMGELNADFPREAFVHILESFGSHTGAAETCLKAKKAAYRWGESRGFPEKSEVFVVSSPHKGRGGAIAWTEEEEKKFLETHGSGTMARRWFYLTKNMAGRIGDTFDIGPESIKLKQGRAFFWVGSQKRRALSMWRCL